MREQVLQLIEQAVRTGCELGLQKVGKIKTEVSKSEAERLYGQQFIDLVRRGRVQPVRRGNGKNGPIYYDRYAIGLALTRELAEPLF